MSNSDHAPEEQRPTGLAALEALIGLPDGTIRVGDRVRIGIDPSRDQPNRQWFDVQAIEAGGRYLVITRDGGFGKGLIYTVITWTDYRYNHVGPGLIETTPNTLGGGWALGEAPEDHRREARGLIDALVSGEWKTSHRRRQLIRTARWEASEARGLTDAQQIALRDVAEGAVHGVFERRNGRTVIAGTALAVHGHRAAAATVRTFAKLIDADLIDVTWWDDANATLTGGELDNAARLTAAGERAALSLGGQR